MILFVLHPGPVMSRQDGEWHHIGAAELMALYDVRPGECMVYDLDNPRTTDGVRLKELEHLVHLRPLSGVDYRPVTASERAAVIERVLARSGGRQGSRK